MKCVSENWRNAIEAILTHSKTPFYAFRTDRVVSNLDAFKGALSITGRRVDLCYSVKTNPTQALVSLISNAGWGLLTSSAADLAIAKKINAEGVIFDAPFKTNEELQIALTELRALSVCENRTDLENVMSCACSVVPKRVGLRIMVPSFVAGHLSRFGFDLEILVEDGVLDKLRESRGMISLTSLHFHIGGQPSTPEQFYRLATFAAKAWKELFLHGFEIHSLSMGGGIPCSLSVEGLKQYADAVKNGLAGNQVPDFVRVLFEPGRAIVEDAGVLCVKVLDISARQGEVFALVDGGSNLVMPAWMLGGRKRIIENLCHGLIRESSSTSQVTVVGPLCAENDQIGQIEDAAGISIGDILVIKDTGAYDWSTRFHFGRKMPDAFLVDYSGHSDIMI